MTTTLNVVSESNSTPKQVARNGWFNDQQLVHAANLTYASVLPGNPFALEARVCFARRQEGQSPTVTETARLFLTELFKQPAAFGQTFTIDAINDHDIAIAIAASHAWGEISLIFTDRNGLEKPTNVVDTFVRALLPQAR